MTDPTQRQKQIRAALAVVAFAPGTARSAGETTTALKVGLKVDADVLPTGILETVDWACGNRPLNVPA